MVKVEIYDAGEKILDRYTVVIKQHGDNHFYGMSENAVGFDQYCGSGFDGYKKGKHLGKKLNYTPLALKNAIKRRFD